MLKTAPVSLETIKLQLIQNRQYSGHPENEFKLSKEAIKYLIKALEYADTTFSQEIETVLTKTGEAVIPTLIKGLTSPSMNVKSTCSMVLVRLGEASVEPVKQFYARHINRANVVWIAEFILDELGESVAPRAEYCDHTFSNIEPTTASLGKVG